jgi:aldose sugar dehydrogenase
MGASWSPRKREHCGSSTTDTCSPILWKVRRAELAPRITFNAPCSTLQSTLTISAIAGSILLQHNKSTSEVVHHRRQVSLLRGHLQGNAWVDSKFLATLDVETGTARIAFDDSHHVYVSTSSGPGVDGVTGAAPLTLEQLLRTPAQDLKNPRGKIMRWNDDGAVPADNPFVQTSDALPMIWSYGHRNPQGLSFDRKTQELWSTEHGPRGGDELNWIRGGHNYGWPVISYGSRYDGLPVSIEVEHVGMDQPVINWTPAIAVSAISFYEGNEFPRWRSNLLIGSLLKQELWRVVLRDQQAVVQELLLRGLGRIRAITTGSDGDIYLALELKQQGLVIRLSPSR